MAIEMVGADDVRTGRNGRGGNGIKYGKYADAIKPLVGKLKEEIERHNVIRVRIDNIRKEMGGEFLKKNDTTIYWGLKSVLFHQGIVVTNATHKDSSKLLSMRARQDGDVLPPSLVKGKKPAEKVKATDVEVGSEPESDELLDDEEIPEE
jgi:hypothetical protein